MHREHVRLFEQLLFADVRDARFGSGFGCQILAPGNDLHAERLTVAGNPFADTAQPENAQGFAVQVAAQPDLPVARAQRVGLGHQIAGDAHDQRPGQFRCRVFIAFCSAHHNAVPLGRRDINRRIAHAACDQQFERRQLAEQCLIEQGSLAHQANDVEALQALHHGCGVGREVVQKADVARGVEHRPVHHIAGYVLPIIEHCDFQRGHCLKAS
ncbi:Uncharacterized protein AC516_4620 [Pseudomonas amygdali pv. sesami]|nr:Uncharacterized protein AC516_4620 [Pseudomonas amygdali pv. sesami]